MKSIDKLCWYSSICSQTYKGRESGWPDWAIFRYLGYCVMLYFEQYNISIPVLGYSCHRKVKY
jgi:hypothetical protein